MEARVQQFVVALKRRTIEGSFLVSKETAEILRMLISKAKFNTLNELLDSIRETGKRLIQASPLEFAIGNTVRRIMYIVREEFASSKKGDLKDGVAHLPSLASLGTLQEEEEASYSEPLENTRELKAAVIASIGELIEELQNIYRNIADQAIEHIHANEVIMTYGNSRTVVEFLKAAGKKRKFEVIVPESAPSFSGHELALTLSKAGIETTLIADSAIFAMMARVNKVIVGTHAVMANGGLIAKSGTHMIALAAKHHSVPFVVCTDTFNDITSPSAILKFEECNPTARTALMPTADTLQHVHVTNPAWDYVPPNLITLYITNFGGHNPSYIYRLLAEYYYPEDYNL